MSDADSRSFPTTFVVTAAASIGYWVVGLAVLGAGFDQYFRLVMLAWPIAILGVAFDMRGSYHKVWGFGSGVWVFATLFLFPVAGPLYSYARYEQLTR